MSVGVRKEEVEGRCEIQLTKLRAESLSPERTRQKQANKACPRKILQIFVHCEIPRLPGGLGQDSNSISKNPTSNYDPIQIAIIRLMSLLLFDVQLVLQFRLSLIDEV